MDKITIGRSNSNDKPISITIESENFKIIYWGEMELADFAKCITGFACQPIKNKFEIQDGDNK